jgi:hypothetical protein
VQRIPEGTLVSRSKVLASWILKFSIVDAVAPKAGHRGPYKKTSVWVNGAVLHRRLVLMNATVLYVNSENRLRFPAIFKTASSGESGLCDAERVGCLLRVWIEEEWFGEAVPIPAYRPDYR